jgi:transcription elongation GreA/GreB family factor/very-short-patch-repair endonuclease
VVRQNFGPISRDGGWRRLNVLFTRARKSICVITSMRPEDIAVDGRTPEGTRALRHYLDYARSGRLIGPDPEKPDAEPESDFEAAVIDALRQRGYEVQPQLGVAGFRIDIAVRHPQHRSGYLAAVECDGATYHSGTSVRDRDRIRQQILEALGWEGRIWRIWSTDWFRNPLGEMDKLCHFLRTLEAQPLRFSEETVEDNVPDAQLADTATAPEAGDTAPAALVLDDEDVDIEIDVGDLVTYASAGTSDESFTVRVTAHMTDPAMGLVAEHTPLAQTLLGATVGDTVVLRVPGQPPQAFEIKGVKRAASAGSATAES